MGGHLDSTINSCSGLYGVLKDYLQMKGRGSASEERTPDLDTWCLVPCLLFPVSVVQVLILHWDPVLRRQPVESSWCVYESLPPFCTVLGNFLEMDASMIAARLD